MTTGLTDRQLWEHAPHCVERLIERYQIDCSDKALGLYLRHHMALNSGAAKMLYNSPIGGRVYQLFDADKIYYPVRRKINKKRSRSPWATVTYLAADMVFDNMMGEGPPHLLI